MAIHGPEILVLNVPHSSTFIPCEEYDNYFLPLKQDTDRYPSLAFKKRQNIETELLMMTDWYTEELFCHGIGKSIVAPVSRLVCDTERFRSDEMESMSNRGMGAVYTNGFDGKVLKESDPGHRESVMEKYYDSHHRALEVAVATSLEKYGKCLILDCHSFHLEPLPYEPSQRDGRCDICIGTDSYHTPMGLIEAAVGFFERRGYSVSVDDPYAGTMVPMKFLHREPRVHSLMIEVNRGLYMERFSSRKSAGYDSLSNDMEAFENEMILRL